MMENLNKLMSCAVKNIFSGSVDKIFQTKSYQNKWEDTQYINIQKYFLNLVYNLQERGKSIFYLHIHWQQ